MEEEGHPDGNDDYVGGVTVVRAYLYPSERGPHHGQRRIMQCVRNDGEDLRHAATLPLFLALRSAFVLPVSASGVRNGCDPARSIQRMRRAAA